MVDIESWTMEDLKRHFDIGYSPANATMVVVGDVTPDEIVKLAQKYIEPIPSRGLPPKVTTREPEQLGERRRRIHRQLELPRPTLTLTLSLSGRGDPRMMVARAFRVVPRCSRMFRWRDLRKRSPLEPPHPSVSQAPATIDRSALGLGNW